MRLPKGDAIVVALMASDIAEGRAFPTSYYGQYYMGAIEAWITAPLYLFFDPDWRMIPFAPVLVSTLGVFAFHLLGSALGGRAAGLACALMWAITPFTITFYNTTPRGCYPEAVAGSAALVWFAARRHAGAECGAGAHLAIGALAGLLLWTTLLSVPAVATAAVFILLAERFAFNGRTASALAGFATGAAPAVPMFAKTLADPSTGQPGLDRAGERFTALYHTAKSVFIPAADLSPPPALVVLSWISFGLLILAMAAVIIRALAPGAGGERSRALLPLVVFTAIFLTLYLLNDRSLNQQTRWLLPIAVSVYASAALLFSWIYSRSRAAAAALLGLIVAPAAWGSDLGFRSIWKGEAALKNFYAAAVKDAARQGVENLVWEDDYNGAYRLTYEAKVQGAPLLAIPWGGARSYWKNNRVEKDPAAAVHTPLSAGELFEGFSACCREGYEKVSVNGADAVRNISARRWPALSIPPDEWRLPPELGPLGDRKFYTTWHSNRSFTVELDRPRVITRIRAIYGRRWPDRAGLSVSTDGRDWRRVHPPSPVSFFVPQGPKVFFRQIAEFERDFQEWNFPPVEARLIRFEIEHSPDREYDIHELFIYELDGTKPGWREGVLLEDEPRPSPEEVFRAARGLETLAADRWYTAWLYGMEGRDFQLVAPSLHGEKKLAAADSKIETGPGVAALTPESDAPELLSRLRSKGVDHATTRLHGHALVTLGRKAGDMWWTGFTLIDYE